LRQTALYPVVVPPGESQMVPESAADPRHGVTACDATRRPALLDGYLERAFVSAP
jgi:hypothetical protein